MTAEDKLDQVIKELRQVKQELRDIKVMFNINKPLIRNKKELVTSVEALKILRFWMPSFGTKPNPKLLLPYVREGQLSRIKIKGNRYLYQKEQLEELFNRLVS